MKRLLGLLVCTFLFNSCDDGAITLKSFNFDPAAAVQNCDVNNGLFFKIKGKEALILEIPVSSFPNEVTPGNEPRTLLIDGSNKLSYRLFNSTVDNTYFCSSIPPISPIVTEEWNAASGLENVSGLIKITTTEIKNPTTFELTGYNHYIVFKNVTFVSNSNSFVYDEYIFGNYVTGL